MSAVTVEPPAVTVHTCDGCGCAVEHQGRGSMRRPEDWWTAWIMRGNDRAIVDLCPLCADDLFAKYKAVPR